MLSQVRYSEESRTRCIGLTIETRPDYCLTPHLTDMLSYGCTRLEMGVQVSRLGAGGRCGNAPRASLAPWGWGEAGRTALMAARATCVVLWGGRVEQQGGQKGACVRALQSIYEDVARDTNRGHTVEAVKECFVLAKDAGFKASAPTRPSRPRRSSSPRTAPRAAVRSACQPSSSCLGVRAGACVGCTHCRWCAT